MNTALIVAILKLIPFLIGAVETLFGAGTGATKKAAVLSVVKGILGFFAKFSKGGQATTFEEIAPTIEPIVDELASVMFPKADAIELTAPSN